VARDGTGLVASRITRVKEPTFPQPVPGAAPPELEMGFDDLHLVGTSMAARATAFAVPDFGVDLDIGRLTPMLAAQPTVLLSHGHLDHTSGILAYLNLRVRFHPDEPPRVVAPAPIAGPLLRALELMPGMESVRKRVRLDDVIVAAEPGVPVPLPGGSATPFAVEHGVPTLGWALRRRGEGRPALVFAADGGTGPFAADPGLLDAAVAVVECTFVEKNRVIAARLAAHAHLSDWLELAPRLACDVLVLTHLPPVPAAELATLMRPLAAALGGRLVVWAIAE
jgi:ribonuclease BN (tRNA processing enzyme)